MTLAGCLTFLIAPGDDAGSDARVAAALSPSLPMVIIDPGHGGRDDGAVANGLVEKNLTLDLAFRVESLLQSYGFKTLLTRRDDAYLSLPERADISNTYDRSLFVSLHFNNSANTTASGIETYYASEKVIPEPQWTLAGFFTKPDTNEAVGANDTGENFAGYVHAALINRTEAGNRGIKPKALYVVRHTRAHAILVEGGFLSNPFEARLISTPEYRDRLAAAIVDGLIQYSNTLPRPPKQPPQLAKASP
jgi:N-acetylmuramoyl-L-alanine amidase